MTGGIVTRQYRRYWCYEYRGSYHPRMTKNTRKLPLADWQLEDSKRLKALYSQKRAELGLTQDRIAAELGEGVTQGAVSHFMNGRTALSLKAAAVFAKMLQVPISAFSPALAKEVESLNFSAPAIGPTGAVVHAFIAIAQQTLKDGAVSEKTPLPAGDDDSLQADAYAFIPQYDAKAAAGLGSENPHVEIQSTLAFKRNWLRSKGAKPEHLIVMYADGQSMQPTINHKDVLLVDRSKIEPVDSSVFVLTSREGAIVKRLVQAPLGQWILRSDNSDKDTHGDRFYGASQGNEHRIIGQVIWRGGDL